ncbi:MAG TPA: hypothetical protein VLL52_12290 [Anaerolineae bacterium]|nr:hypothetical protein [Anaerolineae bacterium]
MKQHRVYYGGALLLILLVAMGLRLWRLGEFPPGLYHDEAYNGLDALSLLTGETFPIYYEGWEHYAQDAHADRPASPTKWPVFFEGNYGREPLHIYLMALSVWVWGATPFAIRLVPAVAGVLAVITSYLCATVFIDEGTQKKYWWAPLVAAGAVAIMYPLVHFSRFGLRTILFVPIEGMVVYSFWRGVLLEDDEERRGRFLWFIFSGFWLGLGVYTYTSARLLPLLFVIYVPVWFWLDRGAFHRYWRPFGALVLTSMVTAAPLLLFFARYPYFFIFRTAYVVSKGSEELAQESNWPLLLNIGRVLGGIVARGETHLRHNLPGRPFLDGIQTAFLALGCWRLVTGFNRRQFFLLVWLGVMLIPSVVSGDAPHFGRMSGIGPVLAILISWGAVWVAEKWPRPQQPRPLLAGLLLLFLLSGIQTGYDYFVRYAAQPELAADFYQPDWALGQYAAAQAETATLFLSPTQAHMATLFFALGPEWERWQSYTGAGRLAPAGRPAQEAFYFVRPEAEQPQTVLPAVFPDGVWRVENDDYRLFYVAAEVPRRAAALAPITASWGERIGLIGWRVVAEGELLQVTLLWEALADGEQNYTAFIHIVDGEGELVAQRDRPPNGYYTVDWQTGEWVQDVFTVSVPAGVTDYQILTGFYDPVTGERLGDVVLPYAP